MKLRCRTKDETGSALVAGVIILFIILMLGLAVLSTSDVQSHQTGHEASGEAAFNLAEGALDDTAYLLQQTWPSSTTASCNQGSAASSLCPGATVTNSFSTTYAGHWFKSPLWNVQLVDDSGGTETSNYYVDSARSGAPSYDANGDNKVWIRSEATVGGQKRVVVAEMVRQSEVVSLPEDTIVAGGTYTSNNGNKIIIESKDKTASSTGASGPVAVRCTPPSGGPTYGDTCTGWDPGHGQLDPANNYQGNYVDPNGGYSAVSSFYLQQLKWTAMQNNTYYNGVCPTNLNGLVYVDNPPGGNCTYTGGSFNGPFISSPAGPATSATPGAIIFGSGSLYFNGNVNYYGIVYMVNAQGKLPNNGYCTNAQTSAENEPVFMVHGTAQVYGGVFVDGCGLVDDGDSAANINFAANAFSGLSAFALPALAKNTFRILSNN